MKMNPKHYSRLHKGFIKQVARQDAKPPVKYIEVRPVIISWDEGEGAWLPLKRCVRNQKWNGMNLKNLCNGFLQPQPDWYYSRRSIKNGKYILSARGKRYLAIKKEKKNTNQ